MSRRTFASIDLDALAHNFQQVKHYAPNSKIMAMIKSNGYGHDAVTVAKQLTLADAFGVACIDEAMTLLHADIAQEIVVMSGFNYPEQIPLFAKKKIAAVIHDVEQLHWLADTDIQSPIPVWFKIDTGMHRLGFLPEDIPQAWQLLQQLSNKIMLRGVMTHLADADNVNSSFTDQQLNSFNELTQHLSAPRSISHSAGIMRYPQAHADWVRPGIMLYGGSPFADKTAEHLQLKPVMTLAAQIIAIKSLQAGDCVGYGCTWQAPENMSIAVVAVGYGDGYPRRMPAGTPVLINGVRCPIVGRVSMDMISVDLRPQPKATIGDMAILWGQGLPADEIAKACQTISYELFTNLTARVPRVV